MKDLTKTEILANAILEYKLSKFSKCHYCPDCDKEHYTQFSANHCCDKEADHD